jgi:hypothetical protein
MGDMGLFGKFLGAKRAAGDGIEPGVDERNPAYERQLKAEFGVDYGEGGWGFEGGNVADMANPNNREPGFVPDMYLDVLKGLAARSPFDKVCIVAGPKGTLLACNTKPQPMCLLTDLDVSGIGDLIARSIKEGGKQVSVYRSTWVLQL